MFPPLLRRSSSPTHNSFLSSIPVSVGKARGLFVFLCLFVNTDEQTDVVYIHTHEPLRQQHAHNVCLNSHDHSAPSGMCHQSACLRAHRSLRGGCQPRKRLILPVFGARAVHNGSQPPGRALPPSVAINTDSVNTSADDAMFAPVCGATPQSLRGVLALTKLSARLPLDRCCCLFVVVICCCRCCCCYCCLLL